jgi:UTP-glucose-1-phosphate uridylyltransferase
VSKWFSTAFFEECVTRYIVDEIVAAGIKEIVLVTHSSKNAVENHFDTSYDFRQQLALHALLKQGFQLVGGVEVVFHRVLRGVRGHKGNSKGDAADR